MRVMLGTLTGLGLLAMLSTAVACRGDDDAADVLDDEDASAARPICTRDGACEESVELEVAQHLEGDLLYGELPPAGGPHDPCWGDFGVHDEAFTPESWVHNIEHGAVVFLHDCPDGCADDRAALEAFVEQRSWAILTGYDGLDARFAALAWGYRLMTDELDLDAFAAFYDAHADQAPESVPSGKPAGCP